MKRHHFIMTIVTLLLSSLSYATELVKWERIPLQIPLHVNQERIVFLDKNMRVGFPASLTGKLRIQSTGGAVYLLALEPFATTRIPLQNVENGEMILLDIHAVNNQKTLEPIKVVYAGNVNTLTEPQSMTAQSTTTPTQAKALNIPLPIALTRYAAQSLYAPKRTIEALPGVTPQRLHLPAQITTLLPTEAVNVSPLAAWSLQGYSVIALKIQNTQPQTIVLDPRQLQGQFISATFQHRWLGALGKPEDTTVVYLVIKGRPEQAFIPEPAKRSIR